MKNFTVSLMMSAALAVPLWAQSQSTPSTTPGAPMAQSMSDREPLTSPRPQNFWDGDEPNMVNLVMHPFATKAYVQRQVAPIRDRVNELDEISSENRTRIKDIDERSQQGIRMASEKVTLADQHATDAASRAELAKTSANDATLRVTSTEKMLGTVDQYQGSAQTEIRFRRGQTMLSTRSKAALDDMAMPLKNQKGYLIEVRGYSMGHGRAATANSQKMTNSVVRYLVQAHNIPVYRIHTMTMGKVPAKRPSGGRIEVSVLQNDLVTSAQR